MQNKGIIIKIVLTYFSLLCILIVDFGQIQRRAQYKNINVKGQGGGGGREGGQKSVEIKGWRGIGGKSHSVQDLSQYFSFLPSPF